MQQRTEAIDPWRRITPLKRTRSFICGSTGSGKSTLGAALLSAYLRFYSSHHVLLIDPKRRFFPAPDDESTILFPQGFHSTNHGRRDGVTVNAHPITDASAWSFRHRALLVQDYGTSLKALQWLYRHADVRRPWLVYLDEAQEYQSASGRADAPLRTVIQQGREIGVGMIAIHQRPRRLDVGHISEAERIYVGTLYNRDDRIHLSRTVALPDPERLREPMPRHTFFLCNQVHPASSFPFKLG